jgi:phage gp36-like protein
MYATVADISRLVSPNILIQLADDDNDQQYEDPVVEDALDRAEGLVNAALGAAGYAVPVALPIPKGAEVIKGATTWLAVCDLAARRGVIPEDYRMQCDLYKGILDQIRQGLLGLPLPAGSINLPQSSTEGLQRRFCLSKDEIGTDEIRNPDEEHTLDVI